MTAFIKKGPCHLILKQLYLPCLAHASYLIGDEESRTAVIVDPQRDIDQYLTFAAEYGLKITHVFLTHFHADFVAGHLELRNRVGAAICLGAAAKATYAFTPFRDGDLLEFGRVRLKIDENSGHTPESIILIYDLNGDPSQPHAVLTGDTLFIGDVGRPDLRAALGWSATDLGSMLFDSLHTKLLPLPDNTLVYPAHGAGSLCGKALSKETVRTSASSRSTTPYGPLDQRSLRPGRHRRPTGCSALLQLRCRAQQPRASDAGPGPGARNESADP